MDLISTLKRATEGLDRQIDRWRGAEPAIATDFTTDRRLFGEFWQLSGEVIAHLPPKPQRTLRMLTRYRKTQIQERQREANRLQKTLEDTGIKLGCVASDVLGVSGRAMLDALLAGTRDPAVLAELARGRLRKKLPQLREALQGRFEPQHALVVAR